MICSTMYLTETRQYNHRKLVQLMTVYSPKVYKLNIIVGPFLKLENLVIFLEYRTSNNKPLTQHSTNFYIEIDFVDKDDSFVVHEWNFYWFQCLKLKYYFSHISHNKWILRYTFLKYTHLMYNIDTRFVILDLCYVYLRWKSKKIYKITISISLSFSPLVVFYVSRLSIKLLRISIKL